MHKLNHENQTEAVTWWTFDLHTCSSSLTSYFYSCHGWHGWHGWMNCNLFLKPQTVVSVWKQAMFPSWSIMTLDSDSIYNFRKLYRDYWLNWRQMIENILKDIITNMYNYYSWKTPNMLSTGTFLKCLS